MGDLLQAARANAVHAFLVLLDLLKGQSEAISQIGLTEFEHQASHANAAADLLVDQDGQVQREEVETGASRREAAERYGISFAHRTQSFFSSAWVARKSHLND
jgi:hypothetical protein